MNAEKEERRKCTQQVYISYILQISTHNRIVLIWQDVHTVMCVFAAI